MDGTEKKVKVWGEASSETSGSTEGGALAACRHLNTEGSVHCCS